MDLRELEHELARLPDVSIARIVANGDEQPAEVHIVARPGKHPKQVVRDVQSVALASFGLRLDHRVVSVVQLDDQTEQQLAARVEPTTRPRVALVGVEDRTGTSSASVQVTLRRDGAERAGAAQGSIASVARPRLVVQATLEALARLVPTAGDFELDTAQIVPVGRSHVAVVTLVRVVPPTEERYSGSAVVRDRGDADALARAALDATNRRLVHDEVTVPT